MIQLPLIMLCTYVQIKVSWFKHSIVLNGLRCGIVRLFDSFVPRRSMIYFNEWGQIPMYSHIAVVAGVKKYRVPKIECPGGNFIFRNPARNCTIIIAYCVNNRQYIGYFLLYKKIDELTSKNGSTENRTRVICFIGVYLYH